MNLRRHFLSLNKSPDLKTVQPLQPRANMVLRQTDTRKQTLCYRKKSMNRRPLFLRNLAAMKIQPNSISIARPTVSEMQEISRKHHRLFSFSATLKTATIKDCIMMPAQMKPTAKMIRGCISAPMKSLLD